MAGQVQMGDQADLDNLVQGVLMVKRENMEKRDSKYLTQDLMELSVD